MAISLSCKVCGNKWQGRARVKGKRRCPKCWSRQVLETAEEKGSASLRERAGRTTVQTPTRSGSQDAFSMDLGDDPQIREKRKELELARIEKEILEVKEGRSDASVLGMIVCDLKYLTKRLRDQGILDDLDTRILLCCPWCKNGVMELKKDKQGALEWKCPKCGRSAQ